MKTQAIMNGRVTLNGKTVWNVKCTLINGDVLIYRYIETKNSRRMISRNVSPTKLKKWDKTQQSEVAA